MDDLNNRTPEELAQLIFSLEPQEEKSLRINLSENNDETMDTTYVFEVLITVLLEGLDIFTGGLKAADLTNFTDENITILDPWFRSLGFKLNVYQVEDNINFVFNEYYCRIVLNRDLDESLFFINNVTHRAYHFLLNGGCLEENRKKENIDELYAVFNNSNKLYVISFTMLMN